jgi:hypothetical protein
MGKCNYTLRCSAGTQQILSYSWFVNIWAWRGPEIHNFSLAIMQQKIGRISIRLGWNKWFCSPGSVPDTKKYYFWKLIINPKKFRGKENPKAQLHEIDQYNSWNFLLKFLKFIYSEKATNFCKISAVDSSYVVTVKSTMEI